MHEELIIAGFGGQGVLSMGQILAYAGLKEGKNVTWMPAYGPETRGGFANCTVIISDEEIGSPVLEHPQSLIVMSLPSFDKFEPYLKPNGLLITNKSMVDRKSNRKDIEFIEINATEDAQNLGTVKMANMIILGAYLAKKKILKIETIKDLLPEIFKGKENLIPLNKSALEKGASYIN